MRVVDLGVVDQREREMGGTEEEEAAVWMYCMREE